MAQHRIINGLGGTGHLATLVECMTRFTLVARVAPKESGCVMPDFLVVCPIRDKAFAGDSAVLTVACCFEPIPGRGRRVLQLPQDYNKKRFSFLSAF